VAYFCAKKRGGLVGRLFDAPDVYSMSLNSAPMRLATACPIRVASALDKSAPHILPSYEKNRLPTSMITSQPGVMELRSSSSASSTLTTMFFFLISVRYFFQVSVFTMSKASRLVCFFIRGSFVHDIDAEANLELQMRSQKISNSCVKSFAATPNFRTTLYSSNPAFNYALTVVNNRYFHDVFGIRIVNLPPLVYVYCTVLSRVYHVS